MNKVFYTKTYANKRQLVKSLRGWDTAIITTVHVILLFPKNSYD